MAGRRIGTTGAMVALAALAACGGNSSSGGASPSASPSVPGATSANVPLKHVPNGTAILSYDTATKSMNVEIHLVGLAPSSSHPAHIHAGSCENQGAVDYPLNSVIADSKGVASSVTAISNIKEGGIPATGWYVNVHNGPGLSPAVQFQPIVCGDVANTDKATHVQVNLTNGPTPPGTMGGSPDQTATGTASLNVSGGALHVMVSVSGLAPSSSHAVHIHLGSCEAQGTVKYPLPALQADATGHATINASVPNVSSIPLGVWYVNVHRTSTLQGQTDFDPILCGDIGGGSGY